jgi:inner membrane protein
VLAGMCLSRTGLNRRAAYATLTMAVAAEFPDIDMLWSLRGPVEGFAHHRGITHTLVGVPFEAALIVGTVYCAHRWRLKRSERVESSKGASPLARTPRPLTLAPVRWGVLYGFALIGLLSHLLLDYTNNYGIRPFFPFDRHWFAGSFVFIFDPLIFGLLVLGLLIPGLLGMIGAEVGVRPGAFRGRGWAIAALAGVLGCWGLRAVEHGKAVALAMGQSMQEPSRPSTTAADDGTGPAPSDAPAVLLTARRALATPGPLNPFAWSVATDFGVGYQLAEADVSRGLLATGQTFYWKPGTGATVQAAEGSALGRAYLDWSPMPLVEVGDRDSEGVRTVTLRDPRFMGAWMGAMGHPQLEGTVEVDAAGKVVRQALDGRVER